MSTGVPFTPGIGGDPLGVRNTDSNIDVPNVLSGPGCDSLVNPGNFSHYIKTECFAVPTAPSQAYWTQNCIQSPSIPYPRCMNIRGNLERNRLIGPGTVNLDFSVFKNNYIRRISDTFNAQFRAEIFNIFNHPNILAPLYNRNIFDSKGNPVDNGGACDQTSTLQQRAMRTIQFALKFMW